MAACFRQSIGAWARRRRQFRTSTRPGRIAGFRGTSGARAQDRRQFRTFDQAGANCRSLPQFQRGPGSRLTKAS
eukprot:5135923-Alexandrium_andersonii.AAC.1